METTLQKKSSLFIQCCLTVVLLVLIAVGAHAAVLQTTEYQVTTSGSYDTLPSIGQYGTGAYVVYTSRAVLPTGYGPGIISYQRLSNTGVPVGGPVQVSTGGTDDQLNDAYGKYIVYTAYDSTLVLSGRVILYDTESGSAAVLASAAALREARIYGNNIVWVQGTTSAGMVMYFDLAWLGAARLIAGPSPSATNPEVGDRFIVWDQLSGNQRDVYAYDLATKIKSVVANDPVNDEWLASTSGPWITWETRMPGVSNTRIMAKNMDTGEVRTIADNGTASYAPTIDGDVIAYESRAAGNFDIYVYRLSTGETFRVTTNWADQRLNNIMGNMVVYVDARAGNMDVYVSKFIFDNPPNANAGPDQTVHAGSLVHLDGSGSSDPDGNVPLTYAWSFSSRPGGSAAALSDSTSMSPTFTADLPGNYVLQLVVTNCFGTASQADAITISTANTAPLAEAGHDQAVTMLGTLVQLDGSQSFDPDGDTISYQWSFAAVPAGSEPTLNNADTAMPSFIADTQGTYILRLVTRDPWAQSAADMVSISFMNVKPVANAGTSGSAVAGNTVNLNGSGSSDANGDPLTYQWSFTSVPYGSLSLIESPTSGTTSFVPDLPGAYVIQLIVNDGIENSDANVVQVQVVASQTTAIEATKNIQDIIASLDTGALKNATMQNTLNNKLNAVIASINASNYKDALDQLQNDILGKTDGCAKTGSPDKNDWIKACTEQNQIYPLILDAIARVKNML